MWWFGDGAADWRGAQVERVAGGHCPNDGATLDVERGDTPMTGPTHLARAAFSGEREVGSASSKGSLPPVPQHVFHLYPDEPHAVWRSRFGWARVTCDNNDGEPPDMWCLARTTADRWWRVLLW